MRCMVRMEVGERVERFEGYESEMAMDLHGRMGCSLEVEDEEM